MAQDISDVIAFVHQHCDVYGMDKVVYGRIICFMLWCLATLDSVYFSNSRLCCILQSRQV